MKKIIIGLNILILLIVINFGVKVKAFTYDDLGVNAIILSHNAEAEIARVYIFQDIGDYNEGIVNIDTSYNNMSDRLATKDLVVVVQNGANLEITKIITDTNKVYNAIITNRTSNNTTFYIFEGINNLVAGEIVFNNSQIQFTITDMRVMLFNINRLNTTTNILEGYQVIDITTQFKDMDYLKDNYVVNENYVFLREDSTYYYFVDKNSVLYRLLKTEVYINPNYESSDIDLYVPLAYGNEYFYIPEFTTLKVTNGYSIGYAIGYQTAVNNTNTANFDFYQEGYNQAIAVLEEEKTNSYNRGYREALENLNEQLLNEYNKGYEAGRLVGFEDGKAEGTMEWGDGLQNILAPAIFIVILLGGIFTIISLKRSKEE